MIDEQPRQPLALLAVGQLFLDLVYAELPGPLAAGREIWTPAFGSGPGGIANQAIAAARLGAPTAVAAIVGDDPFSALCLDALTGDGVDTAACRRVPGWRLPVTTSIAHADDRAMVTGGTPASGTPLTDPPAALTAIADLGADPGAWVQPAAAAGTAVTATIGWDVTGSWDPQALTLLPSCAAFLPNLAEATAYTRQDDPERAARALAELVPLAVVTLGADGVLAVDAADGSVVRRPRVAVSAVDATGAGDVFCAAFTIAGIPEWTLPERLDFAALVAAITVGSVGGAATAPVASALVPWLDAHPGAAEPGRFDFVRRAFAPGSPSPFLPPHHQGDIP